MTKLYPINSVHVFSRQKTFYWIGNLLSGNHDSSSIDQIEQDIVRDRVNWPVFFSFCDQHWILPSVYKVFRDYNLLKIIPTELSDHLIQVYQLNLEKNYRIIEQVKQIVGLLNQFGIEPIFLKGSANLIDGVYEDLGERFMGDIDILVSEKEFITVAHLLEDDGYQSRTPFNYIALDGVKHYSRLNKPSLLADVEVHQLLANPPFNRFLNYNLVNEKKKRPLLIPNGCYVLSDQHKAIHNFVNGQLNDRAYFRANPSLRQMFDLALLSRRTDINLAFSEFGHYRIRSRNYLALTQFIFQLSENRKTNNLFSKFYKLRVHFSLCSEKGLALIIQLDKFFQPVRYYSHNLLRAINEKPYRQRHLKRILSKFWNQNSMS